MDQKNWPCGAKWACERLDSGFVVVREYGEKENRASRLDEKAMLWDFCRWLIDVCSIDDHITISFERSGEKFTI